MRRFRVILFSVRRHRASDEQTKSDYIPCNYSPISATLRCGDEFERVHQDWQQVSGKIRTCWTRFYVLWLGTGVRTHRDFERQFR